jgi:hypothetical protein
MGVRVQSICLNGFIKVRKRYVELAVDKRDTALFGQLGRSLCKRRLGIQASN